MINSLLFFRTGKVIVLVLVGMIMLAGVSCGSVISFVNENETGIVLHPSQSHAYFWIPDSLKSTKPVTIDSTYIVISEVQFEVDAEAPVDVYIHEWNPENINIPEAVLFNFTIVTEYHNQTINFWFGSIPLNVPLAVYKDGELFYIVKPDETHTFTGNVTVKSEQVAAFSDGYGVLKPIQPNVTTFEELEKYIGKEVSIRGVIVSMEDGKWYVQDEYGSIIEVEEAPTRESIIEITNKPTIIKGKVIKEDGIIKMRFDQCMVEGKLGLSEHNYVIKAIVTETGIILGVPATPFAAIVGYLVFGMVIVTIGAIILLVYREYRGK